MQLFEEEYIRFYTVAHEFEAARLKDEKEKADAEVLNATMEVATQDASASTSSMASGNIFETTAWSDDEDDDEEEQDEVDVEQAAREEAKRVLRAWRKYTVNWLELFPKLKAQKEAAGTVSQPLDLTEDLMNLNVGKIYQELELADMGRKTYGYIPLMASCSTGQLGALSAESYCERVLSIANQVVVEGNTLLGDDEVEMITVLRSNCAFMQFMREHYGQEAKQTFSQSLTVGE